MQFWKRIQLADEGDGDIFENLHIINKTYPIQFLPKLDELQAKLLDGLPSSKKITKWTGSSTVLLTEHTARYLLNQFDPDCRLQLIDVPEFGRRPGLTVFRRDYPHMECVNRAMGDKWDFFERIHQKYWRSEVFCENESLLNPLSLSVLTGN